MKLFCVFPTIKILEPIWYDGFFCTFYPILLFHALINMYPSQTQAWVEYSNFFSIWIYSIQLYKQSTLSRKYFMQ